MSGYFIILWFGQFVSDLGSAMTGFAVTIWAFEQTGSALIVSLSGLLIVLPQMMGGALAGPLVDRMDKKAMILFTDVGQGLCSFMLFYLLWTGRLAIGHVYCLNFMGSLIGSFKAPATDVAISLLIPKEGYVRASGMRSFATGTVQVLSPMLAAVLLGFGGMLSVMMFDGLSMLFAVITLFAFVKIPRMERSGKRTFGLSNYVADLRSGMGTIKASRLLMTLLGFTAFVNLAAGLAYYSLLSPMILARSGNDANALAWVNAALGLGGVAGGVLVVILPPARSRIKTMFFCCGLSFLLGDILFSLGRSIPVWVFAGFFSNILIPPFSANHDYFWRTLVPIERQGRVFALRYALQSCTQPIGMLMGGFLADYVLEPFMASGGGVFARLYEGGAGTGMALLFLCTGVAGMAICAAGFFSRGLREDESRATGTSP